MTLQIESYRPDVDGLRAVAVLLVMFYHAGLGLVGGGFVGVDVFFVISGFIIARQSLALHAAGRFGAVDFYARRARRILPPLLLMLVVTSVLAWFLLLPRDMARFGDSVLAIAQPFIPTFIFGCSPATSHQKPTSNCCCTRGL